MTALDRIVFSDRRLAVLADRIAPPGFAAATPDLAPALRQAVGSGKGLRASLALAVAADLDLASTTAETLAAVAELVHAASLVVDDLPAMDDARIRREAPACHLRHGTAGAILIAHALVARGFELLGQLPVDADPGILIARLAAVVGADGMVGGQWAEIVTGRHSDAASRRRKTGGLFAWTAWAPVAASGDADLAVALWSAGEAWGEAYQLVDDAIDGDSGDGDPVALRRAAERHLHEARAQASRARLPGLAGWREDFETHLRGVDGRPQVATG